MNARERTRNSVSLIPMSENQHLRTPYKGFLDWYQSIHQVRSDWFPLAPAVQERECIPCSATRRIWIPTGCMRSRMHMYVYVCVSLSTPSTRRIGGTRPSQNVGRCWGRCRFGGNARSFTIRHPQQASLLHARKDARKAPSPPKGVRIKVQPTRLRERTQQRRLLRCRALSRRVPALRLRSSKAPSILPTTKT